MIEPTAERRAAFRAERKDWCNEIGCGRDDCLNDRLAAVLVVLERDYDVTPKPPTFHSREPQHCPYCTTGLGWLCPWHRVEDAS